MTKTTRIFPSCETFASNISAPFEVRTDQAVLYAAKLPDGTKVSIEMKFSSECDETWVPLYDCCGLVKMESPRNVMVLPLPAWYRVVLTDDSDRHLTDPSLYEDVILDVRTTTNLKDLSQFYHSCC